MSTKRSKKAVPEFQCHIKWKSVVPCSAQAQDIDLRAILTKPDISSLSTYQPSHCEQHRFAAPFDLQHSKLFDLVDLDEFSTTSKGPRTTKPRSIKSSQRSSKGPSVSWLRRTEYLSSTSAVPTSNSSKTSQLKDHIVFANITQVVDAVENSFTDVSSITPSLQHPTNPNLKVASIHSLDLTSNSTTTAPLVHLSSSTPLDLSKDIILCSHQSNTAAIYSSTSSSLSTDESPAVLLDTCNVSQQPSSNYVISIPTSDDPKVLAHLTPITERLTLKKSKTNSSFPTSISLSSQI